MSTKIQWTQETWNPIGGCSRVSPGCLNCYAERQAHRMSYNPNEKVSSRYGGLTQITNGRPTWTGKTFIDGSILNQPLRRSKPTTYFISLSDLFFDDRADEHIDAVFAVMALTPQHTYQVLTKYTSRMLSYFTGRSGRHKEPAQTRVLNEAGEVCSYWANSEEWGEMLDCLQWPFANVQLGVSVEDQKRADERIPDLLKTPASLRFVSYEPALAPVTFTRIDHTPPDSSGGNVYIDALQGSYSSIGGGGLTSKLDWVIVGGESGQGARQFDISWARSAVAQCSKASVPCFVKQVGSNPISLTKEHPFTYYTIGEGSYTDGPFSAGARITDKKGGNPEEWPQDLRVREMPASRYAVAVKP